MHPKTLAALLEDPEVVATVLLTLRALLPGANVSSIVCASPQLVSEERRHTLAQVRVAQVSL